MEGIVRISGPLVFENESWKCLECGFSTRQPTSDLAGLCHLSFVPRCHNVRIITVMDASDGREEREREANTRTNTTGPSGTRGHVFDQSPRATTYSISDPDFGQAGHLEEDAPRDTTRARRFGGQFSALAAAARAAALSETYSDLGQVGRLEEDAPRDTTRAWRFSGQFSALAAAARPAALSETYSDLGQIRELRDDTSREARFMCGPIPGTPGVATGSSMTVLGGSRLRGSGYDAGRGASSPTDGHRFQEQTRSPAPTTGNTAFDQSTQSERDGMFLRQSTTIMANFGFDEQESWGDGGQRGPQVQQHELMQLHSKTETSAQTYQDATTNTEVITEDNLVDIALTQIECRICLGNLRNVATIDCRHFVACDSCLGQLDPFRCIVCRAEITGTFPVYFPFGYLVSGYSFINYAVEADQNAAPRRAGDESVAQIGEDAVSETLSGSVINPGQSTISAESIISPEDMRNLLSNQNVPETVTRRVKTYLLSVNKCLLCRENQSNICLLNCHHLVVCRECYDQRELKFPTKCPYCHQPIHNHVQIFSA